MIHKNFIPEKTKIIFNKLSNSEFIKKYTLEGGTALSLQLEHRLSEDLDFIYDGTKLKINSIKSNLDSSVKCNN